MAEEISPLEDHGWWTERLRKDAKANRPEALRLADAIDPFTRKFIDHLTCKVAADELRRLVAENERLHEMNRDLLNTYKKMRNSAAGYSNFCGDNANTRRCERDYVAAEDMYRAAIAKAEGQT